MLAAYKLKTPSQRNRALPSVATARRSIPAATKASQDPDVQAEFYNYFPQYNLTGNVETDIYNYLMMKDIPDELKEPEMSDEDYVNFMVWHRGLAVPAARHMDDPEVQRGKELFTQMGCAYCHRPSWQTGDDDFTDPTGFFADSDLRLPRPDRH